LNVHQIRRIDRHRVKSDEDRAHENISGTEDWLHWNGDFLKPNDTEDECMADVESGLEHRIGIKDTECPEQQNVSGTPNVSGLIWPDRKSIRLAERVFVRVNAIEMRSNKGVQK
jgi:hypothetical protein